jgi:hypothetical protein
MHAPPGSILLRRSGTRAKYRSFEAALPADDQCSDDEAATLHASNDGLTAESWRVPGGHREPEAGWRLTGTRNAAQTVPT